jgi:hypothetical protein
MKVLFLISLVIAFASCKKNNVPTSFPKGIYVEESLQLDTMDFTVNSTWQDASNPVFDFKQETSLALPIFPTPGFMNGLYQFQIKNNTTIDLRSMLSSNSNFQNYYFNWQPNTIFFEIDKFYIRANLPNRVKFIKL